MKETVWRPIKNTPYMISEFGEVYHIGGKILKHRVLKSGYHRVLLCYDGKQIDKYIHRLVAETFIDNPRSYTEVNHIDGNKANNHYLNLGWVSHSQNHQHAAMHHKTNPDRKLNEEAVKVIKWVLKNRKNISHSRLADLYKVTKGTITDISIGRSWRYVNV